MCCHYLHRVLIPLFFKAKNDVDVLRLVYYLVKTNPLQGDTLPPHFPLSLILRNSDTHLITTNKANTKSQTPLHISVGDCVLNLFYFDCGRIFLCPERQTNELFECREVKFPHSLLVIKLRLNKFHSRSIAM